MADPTSGPPADRFLPIVQRTHPMHCEPLHSNRTERTGQRGIARTAKNSSARFFTDCTSREMMAQQHCRKIRSDSGVPGPRSSWRAIRSAESAIGVSGFFSSCAMRRATSCHAAAFWARNNPRWYLRVPPRSLGPRKTMNQTSATPTQSRPSAILARAAPDPLG